MGRAKGSTLAPVVARESRRGDGFNVVVATSSSVSRSDTSQATNDVSMSSTTNVNRTINHVDGHVLLSALLLPPGGISVEQAQALLGLAVAGHLVLELAALLGEGAGAVMDPLVTVDLLALATCRDEGVVAVVVVVDDDATTTSVILGVAGQDEGVLTVGVLSDDVVDARLLYHIMIQLLVRVHSLFTVTRWGKRSLE